MLDTWLLMGIVITWGFLVVVAIIVAVQNIPKETEQRERVINPNFKLADITENHISALGGIIMPENDKFTKILPNIDWDDAELECLADFREIYQDKRKKYRYRIKSCNNEIITASTQGYASKQLLIENIKRTAITLLAWMSELEDGKGK